MLMLYLLLLLMQMQMLIHGFHIMEDMVLDIMDIVDIMDTQDIMDTTDLMDMDTHTGDNHQFYDQKPQLPRSFLTTLT